VRTTLDIDDDVLTAVKDRAAAEKRSAGKVISELARRSLLARGEGETGIKNGFPQLPGPRGIVTTELIDELLDEEP
jgi:hypothetical protein